MKLYFAKLSIRQKIWLVSILLVMLAIVTTGMFLEPKPEKHNQHFTTEITIKQLAQQLGVTGKAIARELELPLDIPKNKPLKKLAISQEVLDHCTAHLLSHRPTKIKYYLFTAIVLFGLVFLTRLGRPDNATHSEKKHWYPRIPYNVMLIVAVIACGFLLGKSPNPMEGVVKVFKAGAGLYPSVAEKLWWFALFIALAIIGNKIICGWACPFGALQELLYSLPVLRKIKRRKLCFKVTNTIRVSLFLLMLLLLFGVIGNKGFVLYHYINPFNLFDLHFEKVAILLTTMLAILLALFFYRPFCQLICPFGLVSWLAERVSIVRVRVDSQKCNECEACSKVCPLEAMQGKLQGKFFAADCYSCARCLKVCSQDAIRYSSIFR